LPKRTYKKILGDHRSPCVLTLTEIVIGFQLKAPAVGAGIFGGTCVVNADGDFLERAVILFVIVMLAARNRTGDALVRVLVVHHIHLDL
jgi:hypothetical protein